MAYYKSCAEAGSPALRDSNPSVVVIPGLGVYGFGKDKREARITTEFFANAVHVMAGATALEDDASAAPVLPQARTAEQAKGFKSFHNYVALPRSEAFRIEYWALEEAKLQRMPPEREFSRKIALVVGGGSGIGREVALLLARLGAHVVVADRDEALAGSTWAEAQKLSSPELGMASPVDLSSRGSIAAALRRTILAFGGVDIVINTAAIYPTPDPSRTDAEATWANTLHVNVTGNYVLAEEAARVVREQNLPATMVFTSSANAIVPKSGSEAYDVSKAAVNHLIRELAIGLGPAGAREWHCTGHRHCRLVDVPARSRDGRPEEVQHRIRRRRADRGSADETGGLLCETNDHRRADSAAGLRERHLLARRRRQREDDWTRDSRRRRIARSVHSVRSHKSTHTCFS